MKQSPRLQPNICQMFYIIMSVFVIGTHSSSYYPIIESRRVDVWASTSGLQPGQDQQLVVPFMKSPNSPYFNVVLSISSFAQSYKISVDLLDIDQTSFTLKLTATVHAFSYILVQLNYFFSVGQVTVTYPKVLVPNTRTIQTNIRIDELNPLLTRYGSVQPFITQFISQLNYPIKNSTIYCRWNQTTKYLVISRTVDVTKIRVSFVAYLKIGPKYISINLYDGVSIFNNQGRYEPIFIGTKFFTIEKNRVNPYKIKWVLSLNANTSGVVSYAPFLINNRSVECQSNIINGQKDILETTSCMLDCPFTLYQLSTFLVCSNSTNVTELLPKNKSKIPQKINQTIVDGEDQICQSYSSTQNSSICLQCHKINHFIQQSDGLCICQQGYYFRQDIIQCIPCNYQNNQCPFHLVHQYSMGINLGLGTQQLKMRISINKDIQNITKPSFRYLYSQLRFALYINSVKMKIRANWTMDNSVEIVCNQFQDASLYMITLQLENYVLLQGYSKKDQFNNISQFQYQYATPKMEIHQQHKQQPVTLNFIKKIAQKLNSVMPVLGFVSALIIGGSKINTFSYIQISAMLYLSSLIKWSNYGSINRVLIAKQLFKLQPSNLFDNAGLHFQFPKLYTDDPIDSADQNANLIYRFWGGELFITVAFQYLLSMATQILFVQAVMRVLECILKYRQQLDQKQVQCKLDQQGNISWTKKPFIVSIAQQPFDKYLLKHHLIKMMKKVIKKRFEFYLTLINSQLVYYSFMIFLQFTIAISSWQQILNICFAVFVLLALLTISCIGPAPFANNSPLLLLKAIPTLYKKRDYNIKYLYIFYIISVLELFVYGASVAILRNSFQQCLGVILIMLIKLIVLRHYFKRIQFIKSILLFVFFGVLGLGGFCPIQVESKLEIVLIVLMAFILTIQLVKIIRTIIVFTLRVFKYTPSIKGHAYILKIKEENTKKGK